MGTVKSNMTLPDKENPSLFKRFLPKRKRLLPSSEGYAASIVNAERKLAELLDLKAKELYEEKGLELDNSLKLGNLKNQRMHLDAIIDLMQDYRDL